MTIISQLLLKTYVHIDIILLIQRKVLIVMKIQVKLFATFRNGRWKIQEFDYPQDIPVSTVLKDLSLSESDVGMVLVNGIHKTTNNELHDHVVLALVPRYIDSKH